MAPCDELNSPAVVFPPTPEAPSSSPSFATLLDRPPELLDYPVLFPQARRLPRRWTLYVGPTNSGKTHTALQHLKAATRGAYLGPLRLMAWENADTLNHAGVACNLRTGEEHVEQPGAQHVASTIEMADLQRMIDVAVVDEVQLMLDPQRGWAWVQALVGVPAGHLVLTGSPECVGAVQVLAERLGETVDVVTTTRLTPLWPMAAPIKLRQLQRGDALIVFSRRAALDWRAALMAKGWSVATLYGSLGPEVRRAEAQRFAEGRAEILVATDAIGMGLNLPIRRVVFAEAEKFDGQQTRDLARHEWRQIAGRAGRFGLGDHGEAGVLDGVRSDANRDLHDALSRPARRAAGSDTPFLWLPWERLAGLEDQVRKPGLAALLTHAYATLVDRTRWAAPDLSPLLPLARLLDKTGLPMESRFHYLGCPVDHEDGPVSGAVAYWAWLHGEQRQARWNEPLAADALTERALVQEERTAQLASAYLWLAQRWPKVYVDGAKARHRQVRANGFIEEALAHVGERCCSACGTPMRQHKGLLCKACFRQRRRSTPRWGLEPA